MLLLQRIIFLSFCFVSFVYPIQAQVNLVPNPSFEDTVNCPWTYDAIHYAVGWFKPSTGTSDLLHSCSFQVPQNYFGFQNARTGNAYAGLYTYHTFWPDSSYREYISIKLTDSLKTGKKYIVEFYVSRSDSSHYATVLGAYLSSDSISSSSTNNLSYVPQFEETTAITEKSLWLKLSYQYTASGGEKYLTIGNFRNNTFSDTINTNDGGNINNPDYLAAYYFVDDIVILEDSTIGVSELMAGELSIYPNPAKDYFQINQDFSESYDLTIYNLLGQQLFHEKNITSNSKTFDITPFSNGIILLNIKSGNQSINYKLLKS